jgi:S-DNA-T family DNA segregation ATPase FtsK/SpoIIIE
VRLVVERPDEGAEDVELVISDPDATVAELLAALGEQDRAPGIVLDGRFCHSDLALEEIGLYEGVTVHADGPPRDVHNPAPAALELRVVGGLDAGRRMPLRDGVTVTVGRDPRNDLVLDDIGVSRSHVQFTAGSTGSVAVTDLDSSNGTWIEGHLLREPGEVNPGSIVEAGDVALVVATPSPALPFDPLRQVRSDGTAAFNRPPRAREVKNVAPLTLPEAPPKPEKPTFSMISFIGPLIMGGVMVVLLKNIMFAMFMVLSPVLTIGGYFEQRRRSKKSSTGRGKDHREQIQKFREDLSERREDTLDLLRQTLPDVGEVVRRATAPEPSLWERRPSDPDWLRLSGGFAKVPFRPSFADNDRRNVAPEAEKALNILSRLPPAPVEVDLSSGGAVGIVGPREESLAVARSLLCQAASLHGPADLQVVVLGNRQTVDSWGFAKWLPHARDNFAGGSRRQISNDRMSAETLIGSLRERREADTRTVLAVIDSPELIEGRGAPGRMLLRDAPRVSGIILASTTERLPASCNSVIELAAGTAEARLSRPQEGQVIDPILVSGITEETAVDCARGLARFEDADMTLEGGTLPTSVELLPLLGLGNVNPDELSHRWKDSESEGGLRATIAMDRDGAFGIDLVRDGPHGLIAGTTGSGKSEMLRSLVAALAARYSPERLNFVLIDYKGGSAFARCAELPHTVGMVTDLDEQLGARALTSMEAELRFRERKLREYGADDVPALNKLVAIGQAEPLPRLVVIIDEFATLASELPDFVSSLVGIAQRGRSLGVHLLLATQRPSGAVNENIRANTNIRICLRVQTPQDSNDVLDDRLAATISRIQPGRAYVRLGPGEIDPIQTALVTGPAVSSELSAVRVRPFELVVEPLPEGEDSDGKAKGAEQSSLDLLVAAAVEAHADRPPPRRPWLEPLGTDITLEQVLAAADRPGAFVMPFAGDDGLIVPVAIADDPARQTQYPAGWNLDAGNLLLYGIGGSGTTTALQTLTLSLALRTDPNQLHMYLMDFGAGELAPLAELPHVGAVLGASENERQTRLIRMLRTEVVSRREHGAEGRPRIVVMIDGYAGFVSEHSGMVGDAVRDEFIRIFSDGPEVGVHVVIVADRSGAIPGSLVSLTQQRLVMQLADVSDYSQFGLRRQQVPRFNPGKAVLAGPLTIMQMARASTSVSHVADVVKGAGALHTPPVKIGVLPTRVTITELLDQAAAQPKSSGADALWLPIAIEDGDLVAAGWTFYPGEHAIVTGPARTGRTSTLMTIATVCAALHPEIEIAAAGSPRSALLSLPGLWGRASNPEELTALLEALSDPEASAKQRLLLIDDADTIDDSMRGLATLLSNRALNLNAIAAGRPETFRALGHWSVAMRGARNGMLLNPDVNLDGGPLGLALPRRPAPPSRPGAGFLVASGTFGLAQVALADTE